MEISARPGKFVPSLLFRLIAPLAIIISTAWPDYSHFKIDRSPPSTTAVEIHLASPEDQVLDELSKANLAVSLNIPQSEHADFANRIIGGEIRAPQFLPSPTKLTGLPGDLHLGGPTFQLILASLAVEDLLLEAFERSRDMRYLRTARERILFFAKWEKEQRHPVAFLWNDHAVAARIPVLIRLWRHLRKVQEATPEEQNEIIALVERSGRLLAKDSQFTVRTNHGVMQNIALLQISAGFPHLPEAKHWLNLAMRRLELQLDFFVSDEGVVLEHSAEYHVFGNELLALVNRLAYLNGHPVPASLPDLLGKASRFTSILSRPDGTLPGVGNTVVGVSTNRVPLDTHATQPVSKISPPFPAPDPGARLFPLSGYAVWWSKAPKSTQTIVAWSKHDRHGHKHADETSVNFWSSGIDWISGTGYWPYGDANFSQAVGWLGSNAPHHSNEKANSPRNNLLLSTAEANDLKYLEVETTRANGFSVRRQILQLQPESLLVLDFFTQSPDTLQTLWTLDPRVKIDHLKGNSYSGTIDGDPTSIGLSFASSPSSLLEIASYRGSLLPFAGWVVRKHQPTAAHALMTKLNQASGVIATVIALDPGSEALDITLHADSHATNWTVSTRIRNMDIEVKRSNSELTARIGDQRTNFALQNPADISTRATKLGLAMSKAIEAYPPWRPLSAFKQRLYAAIAALWLAIEFGLLLTGRWQTKWINVSLQTGWIALAWWIHRIYLV